VGKYRIPMNCLESSGSKKRAAFKDTSFVDPLDDIIGQKRAVEAIDFGLNMKGPEYNIFVTGLEGTGRSTIIRKLLNAHAMKENASCDLCMVNNFDDEYRPRVIEMPQGTAVYFSRSMEAFLNALKINIPDYFQTALFRQEQEQISARYSDSHKRIFDDLEKEAAQYRLAIHRTENGYVVVPQTDGTLPDADAFDPAVQAGAVQMESRLNEALEQINALNRQMNAEIKDLASVKTAGLISEQIDPLRYYFKECSGVKEYLNQVKEDLAENVALFLGILRSDDTGSEELSRMAGVMANRYKVNVLVDRRNEKGAPVVFEFNPSFGNLFGKIEKRPAMGSFSTDFTRVQAGSLLRANNGYLVINIDPLLQNPPVWERLKQTLRSSSLQIEDMPDQADYGMPSLKPAPIPLQVKVVLIGGYDPFLALQSMDSGFNKIFKVRADFDYEIRRDRESESAYAGFVSLVCRSENLLPVTFGGVEQIIEHGSRLAETRRMLTLQFGKIRALLKEANYWAGRDRAARIGRTHVTKAIQQYRRRHNLYEDKVLAQFDDESVLLSVTGRVVGQVNALAVYDMGEIAFGRPTRITAESYMGTPGLINVERESELSGQTHDKGMMIISGYLGRIFAQEYPLSVSISITFEQSYDGVDGDSASSTELYAVLSSLSEIPIRQEIAVTGSVNQKGEIQAIGGVNEKIEGFFEICAGKGLTGSQGVMIPASNIHNLVLRDRVKNAIKNGRFHLYGVSTIEEGIEVLTGVPAGEKGADNQYFEGTVFGEVQKKLAGYHQLSGQFSG
jgi:lon-related putative ATP-dependent protease